jgi:hypothetical protein
MVTCHDLGEISHNREEEYERRAVETPPDLAETVRSLMAKLQSCKDDNERMIKEKEKKTEINVVLLQSLSDIQRKLQHGKQPIMWTYTILRKLKFHLRYESMVLKVATQGGSPQRRPNMEPRDTKSKNPLVRKMTNPRDILEEKLIHIPKGEERRGNIPRAMNLKSLRKQNHPLSMEKLRRGKKQKFWLLGLKKYFRVHDYYENLKARITIFNLNGKASIWWEDLRNVKGIHEKDLSWKQFEKYFKKKYLLEKYFDGKTKEFYELKMGQLTIDEYINKFLELIRYVPYIKDEKVKMQ